MKRNRFKINRICSSNNYEESQRVGKKLDKMVRALHPDLQDIEETPKVRVWGREIEVR